MTQPTNLPPKAPRVCRKCGKTTTEWQFSGPYSAPGVIDVICMDCWAKWARGKK